MACSRRARASRIPRDGVLRSSACRRLRHSSGVCPRTCVLHTFAPFSVGVRGMWTGPVVRQVPRPCMYPRSLSLRYDNAHAQSHFTETGHAVCVNVSTRSLWCYVCDTTVMKPPSQSAVDHEDGESADASTRGLTGLNNLGNTCFLNAVLQCLMHVVPLVTLAHDADLMPHRYSVASHFMSLVRKVWSGRYSICAPRDLLQSLPPHLRTYDQQDAHELLRFLIDALHEDMSHRSTSLIADLFRGQLVSFVKCQSCEGVSSTVDPFFDLSLEIPGSTSRSRSILTYFSSMFTSQSTLTLHSCLQAFCAVETLIDRYQCDLCRNKVSQGPSLKIPTSTSSTG